MERKLITHWLASNSNQNITSISELQLIIRIKNNNKNKKNQYKKGNIKLPSQHYLINSK